MRYNRAPAGAGWLNADNVDFTDLRREEMARGLRRFAQNDLNADNVDSTDFRS